MEYAPYWPEDPLAEAVAGTTQFPPVYSFLLMLCGGGASPIAVWDGAGAARVRAPDS